MVNARSQCTRPGTPTAASPRRYHRDESRLRRRRKATWHEAPGHVKCACLRDRVAQLSQSVKRSGLGSGWCSSKKNEQRVWQACVFKAMTEYKLVVIGGCRRLSLTGRHHLRPNSAPGCRKSAGPEVLLALGRGQPTTQRQPAATQRKNAHNHHPPLHTP